VLLVLAIPDLPYGYYRFLRWVICAGSIYHAYLSYETEKKFWIILYAIIAILFNPIIPIYLDKNIWVVIDMIVAILILISFFFIKKIKEEKKSGAGA